MRPPMPSTEQPDPVYRHCESLIKGLSLLAELNRSPNASAVISELSRTTGLHRTTVKRLLETLKHAGYLEHDLITNEYRLSFRVLQLSYGYRDTTRVTELAWPFMRTFTQKMVWPCSLVAPEGDEMVVRISTRPYSKLSFHPGMPGRRMPMVTTAAGRAYFAFASKAAQETLLAMLCHKPDIAKARHHHSASWIHDVMDQTRTRGYAINRGEWEDEPRFSAFAVPIRNTTGEAIVALNVIFLTTAVKTPQAQNKLLEGLHETARAIEAAYAQNALEIHRSA
ncbi:MAG: helix-turn-helix domain-containing protein [Alcaligenaceae bacterium]|nr:helix-turn-helix domain-containing protein [Alcaligenaceae bacterium]